MSRLTVQRSDDWVPFKDRCAIAVLDRSTADVTAAFGWVWDEVDEEGLGPMFYLPLAWDGASRFLLSASGFYPDDGIAVEASAAENFASARADLLTALGLERSAWLAITEGGDVWFARWDPPHNAGQRPSTATHRSSRGS